MKSRRIGLNVKNLMKKKIINISTEKASLNNIMRQDKTVFVHSRGFYCGNN